MNKMQQSPNFMNGRFTNKIPWESPSFAAGAAILWKFIFSSNQRKPDMTLPRRQADLKKLAERSNDQQLSVTWLGHSSLLINLDGYRIATDPVLQKKVSLFGPARYNGEAPLEIRDIPELDVVFISHNHYDHLNKWSIQQIRDRVKRFVVPLGVGAQLRDWGVPASRITEMDWWEETTFGDLTIACTPTQHFSGRGLTDRNKTLWASFVVAGPEHKIYYGGDSGYFEGFKQIGEKYGPFEMTFLECGAYDRRWHHIHMFPEETVQAHLDLHGKVLHPIHWGTFNLALHAWDDPMKRLIRAADQAGITAATPVVGGTTVYPDALPQIHWWEKTWNSVNEKAAPLELLVQE